MIINSRRGQASSEYIGSYIVLDITGGNMGTCDAVLEYALPCMHGERSSRIDFGSEMTVQYLDGLAGLLLSSYDPLASCLRLRSA